MIKIKTPTTFKSIESMLYLESIDCNKLLFSDGSYLNCAKDHLLFDHKTNLPLFSTDSLNKTVKGKYEPLEVKEIIDIGNQPCYDLSVEGHEYYTNNVISHNSTITVIYLVHYILFNSNKTVAILANKGSTAREILSKLKIAYQNLPRFLQMGIIEWNKGSIELENGSKVIAAASSSSNIRGMSISCLMLDECLSGETQITVQDMETNEIKNIPIEQLYNELQNNDK